MGYRFTRFGVRFLHSMYRMSWLTIARPLCFFFLLEPRLVPLTFPMSPVSFRYLNIRIPFGDIICI